MNITHRIKRGVAASVATALLIGTPGPAATRAAAQAFSRPEISAAHTVPVPTLSGILPPLSATLAPAALPASPASIGSPTIVLPVDSALRQASPAAVAVHEHDAARAVTSVRGQSTSSAQIRQLDAAQAEPAAVFDGERAVSAVRTSVLPVRTGTVVRLLSAALLAVGLMGAPLQATLAQTAAVTPQQAASTAAPGGPQAPAVQTPLPRPLTASVTFDRSDATIGEMVQMTVTLRNTSGTPVTLAGLRSALTDALPEDIEIRESGVEAPLTLAPGESQIVVYRVVPFAAGQIPLKDVVVAMPAAGYPDGIEIVVPDVTLTVKSVLTADYKEKGLRDIVDVLRARTPNWIWVAGGALAFLLLLGAERVLAARRWYPKLDDRRLSLIAEIEGEFAALESSADSADSGTFHAGVQELVTRFMVDFAGLPRRERNAAVFARDIAAQKVFTRDQARLASDIARRSETARFSNSAEDSTARLRELSRLRALIENVAGRSAPPQPRRVGGLGAVGVIGAAAGLQFGSPWALLMFVPFAAYLWKTWRARGLRTAFTVSSAEQTPAPRSWRERLSSLPKTMRMAAIALIISALARPMIGIQRLESYTPSTDTVIVEDRSGSMSDKMGSGTKLEAAAGAIAAYIDVQRQGTQNRVAMETFDDVPYIDVRLTTDYDALIAHLKEINTGGSTAIGEAILTAVGHFAEVNIMDLESTSDSRIAELKRILRERGLAEALAYAKPYPDLMDRVLHPERAKVVVLFTDGDSNTGINPVDAARIAASLGVKVYTVGVGEQFDEKTLIEVARTTKAQFYKAGDAQRMKEVLLEIGRLEKSPTKIVSSISVNDYTALLALLAFALLGAEGALANTRLRSLQAMIFALALPAAPLVPFESSAPAPRTEIQAAAPSQRLTAVPAELRDGNRLYAEGRFDEAVKKYAEGVAVHPEAAELYFNMADAYLRMGDVERAQAAYQRFLDLTPDPAQQSKALFNLGNSQLMRKDVEGALDLYKEALRRDPSNESAKWNIEYIKEKQKEQEQKDSKDSKDKKSKKQKPKKGKPQSGQGQPQPGGNNHEKRDPSDKSSDQKGDPQDPSKDPAGDKKKAADTLTEKLGDQQQKQDETANKAITRKGTDVWGWAGLPVAGLFGQGVAFTSPWVFAAVLAAVPVAAGLLWYGLRRNLKSAKALVPASAPPDAKSWWGMRRYVQKSALAVAALSLVGLAATDPRGGAVDERVNFGGKDIVALVDDSYSMVYAEDGRATQAKAQLTRFISKLHGTDRVGLVVFSGDARTASPISIDYGNFEYKINRLELEARGLKEGSDLAGAVKFAVKSFDTIKKIGERPRILIVISDGEVFDSQIEEAVKAARENNVTIYAIGLGSPEGTRMKVPTVDGKGTEFLMDSKTGAPAQSHLVEEKLRRLAESTGGAYFRAEKSATIDKIMESVASLEKGHKSDAIKSPQSVGVYLLWPALALLLLDLLLPGKSFLRRESPPKPKVEEKKSATGSGVSAAALIPLAAWPQIVPFALIGAVAAALIAVDVWRGGLLTRLARESWQRRMKMVENGVIADLPRLFELREADILPLSNFAASWKGADDGARRALIAKAAEDRALWREKLVVAYLLGAAPETHERILRALTRGVVATLEPLAPIVNGLVERRRLIAWLDHSDARERVMRLEATAGVPPLAPNPPAAAGAKTKFARTAAAALALVALAIGVVSGNGTFRYSQEQAKAEESAFRIFYGEDAYVFNDRYIDDRIPAYVLPAFRRWSRSTRDAGAEMQRAVQILRESPDPKADNLLIVAFRRESLLPFNAAAESTLLRALVERDSDALWESLDKIIAESGRDSSSAARLAKLIDVGVESGGDHAVMNLFRILKSPNKALRHVAFEKLYGAMTAAQRAPNFIGRMTEINAHFASDPGLQGWSTAFVLRRAASPEGEAMDAAAARAFTEQVIKNAVSIDASRVPLYALALAQAQQAGGEPQTPPVVLAVMLGVYESFAQQTQGEAPTGPLPPMLAALELHVQGKAVNELLNDAGEKLSGLSDRLITDGVLPTEAILAGNNYRYGSSYGFGIFYGFGGYRPMVNSVSGLRDFYTLRQLRLMQKDLAEVAQSAQQAAGDNADKVIKIAEFAERADEVLKAAIAVSVRAGIPEGDATSEVFAAELQPILKKGTIAFKGVEFLEILREKGMAPKFGDASTALAYPLTLDAQKAAALRAVFAEMARTGKTPGGARDLSWGEKSYLAAAVDDFDTALHKNFADIFPKGASSGVERAGEEALTLVRYSAAVDAAKNDGAELLRLERLMLSFLSKKISPASYTSGDVDQALFGLLTALGNSGRSEEGWRMIEDGVNAGTLSVSAAGVLLRPLAEAVEENERAFVRAFGDGVKPALINADLLVDDTTWRAELTLRHYDALLSVVRAEAARERAASFALNPAQSAVVRRIEADIPKLRALAAKIGVVESQSPSELKANNQKHLITFLHLLYLKLPGSQFWEAAVARGVAVPRTSYDHYEGWLGSYTPQQAAGLTAFLKQTLDSGQWNSPQTTRDLTDDEKMYLKAAIKAVEHLNDEPAAPPALGTPLHSVAPLGFSLIASSLGPWAVAGVVALIATWLILKYAARPSSLAAPSTEETPDPGRATRIEFTAKQIANATTAGAFRSRFIGLDGSELAESRPYEPGDDFRSIDWKTTAKSGDIYTRQMEQEREMPLILLIDVSRSGHFAAHGRSKREVIAEITEALTLAAVRSNVRVGAVLFSGAVNEVIPPRGGSTQVQRIAQALENVKPEGVETKVNAALDVVESLSKSRAMVAVISDFLASDAADGLAALSERHDVRSIRVYDPAETSALPDVGLLPVSDAEAGGRRMFDTSAKSGRSAAAAAIAHRESRIAESLDSSRLRPLFISTAGDPLQALAAYFNPKSRDVPSQETTP